MLILIKFISTIFHKLFQISKVLFVAEQTNLNNNDQRIFWNDIISNKELRLFINHETVHYEEVSLLLSNWVIISFNSVIDEATSCMFLNISSNWAEIVLFLMIKSWKRLILVATNSVCLRCDVMTSGYCFRYSRTTEVNILLDCLLWKSSLRVNWWYDSLNLLASFLLVIKDSNVVSNVVDNFWSISTHLFCNTLIISFGEDCDGAIWASSSKIVTLIGGLVLWICGFFRILATLEELMLGLMMCSAVGDTFRSENSSLFLDRWLLLLKPPTSAADFLLFEVSDLRGILFYYYSYCSYNKKYIHHHHHHHFVKKC